MSSFLASRQAATAKWAQHPVLDQDEHTRPEQLYPNQSTHTGNVFRPSSPFYYSQDTDGQAVSGTAPAQSSVQRRSQSLRPSSNTLQPTNAITEVASPAFSFDDYLTPEFSSSDNLQSAQSLETTPSISELKWHETHSRLHNSEDVDPILYRSTDNADFDLSETLNALGYDFGEQNLGSPPTIKTESGLPASTNTLDHYNPEPSSRSQPALSLQVSGLPMSRTLSKRSRKEVDSDAISEASHRDPRQLGNLNAPSISQVVSPSVLVSTYTRGDSPARAQFPMARSLSKRSQSSRLGESSEAPEQQSSIPASSRLMPPGDMEDDWEEENNQEDVRSGLAPEARDTGLVPSLKDLDQQKELNETRAGVEQWLATSEAGSLGSTSETDKSDRRRRTRPDRLRSRSTGTRYDAMGLQIYDDSHIPGPGVPIDETSDWHYSDDSGSESLHESAAGSPIPESPPAQVDAAAPVDESYFPPVPAQEEQRAPEEVEPLPKQFFRRTLWEDPVRTSEPVDSIGQLPTANAAMVYYDRQAAQFETASRAATWGTRRRLSDGEIASIIDGTQVSRHLSLKDTIANRARARGSSFMNSVKKSIPGRSNSFIKKRQGSTGRQPSPDANVEQPISPKPEAHRNSTSSINRLHRMSSSSRKVPKSPPLDTGGAFMAMTSNLAAVGGSSAATPDPERSNSLFSTLKRHRSRSDISKSPKPAYGLSQLFTQHVGPPAPMLASPLQLKGATPHAPGVSDQELDDDADDDEEVGIRMDLPMQPLNIIPDLDGFKTQVRHLNPRLEPFLVDRIATDQLRRYKKLVKSRAEHMQTIKASRNCSSGAHCHDLGGKATLLAPRANSKDTSASLAQFKVTGGGGGGGDSDAEEANFVDGIVTPALFPPGIPLPPTKTLPAEFECFLCFQVKKFHKPSDWTKHVHEDVQPFSCTFPSCAEPKSFKRKADWVRHENERHRHLEWWKCSIQECNHVCFRKDNFVQHLVREHKMTEPKTKGPKPTGTRSRTSTRSTQPLMQTPEDFWNIVESCRHETTKKPKEEPCKFCGNTCNTWKKLSVHMGKHMEQIAMPVLTLARDKKVTAETVVSPIDPPMTQNYGTTMLDTTVAGPSEQYAHSPYPASAHSTGHSPAVMQADPQTLVSPLNQNAYQSNHVLQSITVPYGYDQYGNVTGHEYMPTHSPTNYTQPQMAPGYTVQYPPQIPRSLPMESNYSAAGPGLMPGNYGQPPFYQGAGMNEGYVQSYVPPNMAHEGPRRPVPHAGHSSHGHTPVSGVPTNDDAGFYRTHQRGPSGQSYY